MSDFPEGYTWPNRHLMVSRKAAEQIEALLQQSDNRNPEFHDMYVYNDFHGYGVCHLIVSELKKIHKALSGKEQDIDEAWTLLESLVVFMETEGAWSMVEDADLQWGIGSGVCSAMMTVVNALKEQGRLNRECIPNVEHVLRIAHFCGPLGDFDGGPDGNWLNVNIFLREIKQIVREELEPTDEVKEQEKKWYEAWKAAQHEKIRKAIERAQEEDGDGDEDEGNREDEWYLPGNEADAPAPKATTFKFTTWYNKLQKHLKEVPVVPFRGPPEWDLTKWTKEERAPFAFGGMDSDDDLAGLPGGVKELLEELAKRGQMDAEDFSGEDDEDEEDEEEEEEERPQKRQKQSGGQAKGKQPAKNQSKGNQSKGNQQKGGQQKGGPKKGSGNGPKGKPPGAAKGAAKGKGRK
ncbi:hypothetical protein YB2330_006251 [Saitoella coloradoensis]